ncbi:hypothetical protein MASR2M70_03330 [Bacillota bacterium]
MKKELHEYSTAPKYAGGKVQIKITAYEVIVLDDTLREVINHRRLYGNTKQESMQWIPYLEQLSVRPGALKYTGIYQIAPAPRNNTWIYAIKVKGDIAQSHLKNQQSFRFQQCG